MSYPEETTLAPTPAAPVPRAPSSVQSLLAPHEMEGMFAGLDTMADALPLARRQQMQELLTTSVDPAGDKALFANVGFLADSYGKDPAEVAANIDAYRANYAQQMGWGEDGADDGKFYARVGKHFETRRQERTAIGDGFGLMFDHFRTGGDNWQQSFTTALAEMKGKPGFDPKRLDVYRSLAKQQWEAWNATGQHYPAAVESVQGYFKLARTGTGTETQQVEARALALRALSTVPEHDVEAILGLAQRDLPAGPEKSGVEKMAARTEKGVADTATAAVRGFSDLLTAASGPMFGVPTMLGNQRARKAERQLDMALAGQVDPNTSSSWLAEGVLGAAEGLPRMVAMFSGPGIAVNLAAFSEEARGHFEDAGVAPDKAAVLGPVAGIPLTALMAVTSQTLLGRVAGTKVEGWLVGNLAGKTGSELVRGYTKNILAAGAIDTAALGTMTAGQMLTEPAIQSVAAVMDQTIPGVQWTGKDGEFAKLAHATPQTLAGLVPLIVLGTGMGVLRSREFARNTVHNEAALEAIGVPADTIKAMQKMEPDAAVAELQQVWDKRAANPEAVQAMNEHGAPVESGKVSLNPDGTYLVKDATGAVADQAASGEMAAQAAQDLAASNVIEFPAEPMTAADRARMRAMESGQQEQAGPELLDWIKGRLPRPDSARAGGEPLHGELRGIWDNLIKENKHGDLHSKKAEAFFAKKGVQVDLDRLAQEAKSAGFNFDTPADLLAAVDNSQRGNRVFANPMEDAQAFGAVAGGGRIGRLLNEQVAAARQTIREVSALPVFKGFNEVLNRWVGDTQLGIMHTAADVRQVVDALPDNMTRRAVGRWLDAGGDKGQLEAWAKSSESLPAKQEYEAALKLTAEQIKVAEGIRRWFDQRFQRAVEAGIMDEKQFRSTYLTQLIERPFVQGGDNSKFGQQLNKNFKFSKERVFPNLFELEAAGFAAKTTDVAEIMARYDAALNKAILTRQLVKDLLATKNDAGEPLAVPLKGALKEGEGKGPNYITNPRQVTVDQVQEQINALQEKAKALRETIAANTDFQSRFDAADELKGIQEDIRALEADVNPEDAKLYKSIDHPALRKWWWLGKDAAGKEVFMEGDIGLHPDIKTHLENALGTSGLRKWYDSNGNALASIPKRAMKALDLSNAFLKRNLLGGLSLFHSVHEYKRALGNRVAVKPWDLPEIDMNSERVKLQVRTGLMIATPHDVEAIYNHAQGLGEKGTLIDGIPVIGKLSKGVSEYTFSKLIPALKSEVWNHVYERNLDTFKDAIATGEASREQIAYLTSHQINARFGHMNLADLGRNPTLQHILQITTLAPDFWESNLRNYGQDIKGLAGAKTGREPAVALAVTAGTLWLTSRILNKALDDDWHFEEPFAVIADGRTYTMRNEAEDLVRMWKNMRGYLMGRLSPSSQAVEEFLSGRNWRGEKITTTEVLKNWISKVFPMSLRFLPGIKQATDALESGGGRTVTVWQQFLGSIGVQVARHSDLNEAYQLANDWRKKQGDAEDKGTYPTSKYQQLRYALEDDDAEKAAAEMAKLTSATVGLAKVTQDFHASLFNSWTGSARRDIEFKASLSEDDRKQVEKAEAHRQAIWDKFVKLRDEALAK